MSSCRLSSLALLLLTTSSFLLVGEVAAAAGAANLGENRDLLPRRRKSEGAANADVGFGEIAEAHTIITLAHDEKVADDNEEEQMEQNRLLRSNIFYRGPQKPKYGAKRCYRLINRSCGQCRRYIRKRAANFKCQSTSRCKRQFDFCMAKRQRFFLRKCERFANRWTKASCSPPTKQIGFFRSLPQLPVGRDSYASCSAQPWVRPTGRPVNATTSQTSFQITAQLDIVQLCGDSGDVAGQVKKAVIDRFSNVLIATKCAAYFQNINIQINSVSVASNCPREDGVGGRIRRKLAEQEQSSDLCMIDGTTWGTTTCTIEIYGVGDELVPTYFPSLAATNDTTSSEGGIRMLQSPPNNSGDGRARTLRASATTSRQLIDSCVCDQSLEGIVPSEDTGGIQCARMISDGAPQTDMPNSVPTASPSSGPSILSSPSPSGMPSTAPSSWPSAMPSISGMPTISSEPSSAPSISAAPTKSSAPTTNPSAVPSSQPSDTPSANPTLSAMPTISAKPSASPTVSAAPTTSPRPSGMPSSSPSSFPTLTQSSSPSAVPSLSPSLEPSSDPTSMPSSIPSSSPSSMPSSGPTSMPSSEPSASPSGRPSGNPSSGPSSMPSSQPSSRPSSTPSISAAPTISPQPSSAPTVSHAPSISQRPSSLPSASPSSTPSDVPSTIPSAAPSADPSSSPSSLPSSVPSVQPSSPPSLSAAPSVSMKPSSVPTMSAKPSVSFSPSSLPSISPSNAPSPLPSADPSTMPSSAPSMKPTVLPSTAPSDRPSSRPSSSPSLLPSKSPTNGPSVSNMPSFHYQPSSSPSLSLEPSALPSSMPSYSPSGVPTLVPSANPSALPSISPSSTPTVTASASPSRSPSPTDLASAPPSTVSQGQLAELDAKLKQLEELLKNLTPTRSPAPSVSPAPSLSMAPTQCIAGLGSPCTDDGLACCVHPKNDEYSAGEHVSDLSNSVTCEASSSNFGGGGADSKTCCIAENMPCSYEEDGCCNGQCSFVNESGTSEFRCVVGSP